MSARALMLTVVAGALALAQPVVAQEIEVSFSGSAAFTSDYTFRGISQTLEDPAVQAEIAGEVGPVYFGLWGSSLDFGESDAADRATAEVDIFGGFATSLGGAADLDIGFTYFLYPGTSDTYDYNFFEFALGLSRGFSALSAGVMAAYSPDYFAASGSSLYLGGSLGLDIPETPISLSASVGQQKIDDNDAFGTPDYVDYSIGASVSVLGVGLGLAFVGTDLEETDCFGGSELCNSRVVLSASF